METDYLVIGGGSAGCVMASRLSEDPKRRVILVEAGKDEEPPAIRSARFLTYGAPRFLWNDLADERGPFAQPKVLGGGSAINAMHMQRGAPQDYDEWAAFGVHGWSYADVLPYFQKVESDLDFAGAHGHSGPIKVHRVPPSEWSGLSKALAAVLPKRGLGHIPDMNAQSGDGFGAVPLNMDRGERISAARGYLSPTVRQRKNLLILSGSEALRLRFAERRVIGAEIRDSGGPKILTAGETVLCCGGVYSAGLLLRSGVGPGAQLRELSIPVVADRPGVGENLYNHPMLFVGVHLRAEGRQPARAIHPCPFLVRYSSGMSACTPTDMLLNVWERVPGRLAWDPSGSQVAILNLIVNKVYSRGSVKLDRGRPQGPPKVQFNFLTDERDLLRMIAGVSFLRELLNAPQVTSVVNEAFAPVWPPIAITMMGDGTKAQFLSLLGSVALRAGGPIRRRALRDLGVPLDQLAASKTDDIATYVRTYMLPSYHVSGTCRLGRQDDPAAVVDNSGRVLGVDRLRVADASIFPTLMAAGCNLPVMMTAEKIASAMLSEQT
ncbi:MAG: glucose-methanol-choline oxidoreductase [Gammaproteobacteria bacterium]|nr:glucose-methanol-choline oxidoreductase [Gammaproteobacteria bacterium]